MSDTRQQINVRVSQAVNEAAGRRAKKEHITRAALVRATLRFYAEGGVLPRPLQALVREELVATSTHEEAAIHKPLTVRGG